MRCSSPGCKVVSHDRGSWTGSRPTLAYEGDEANPARWFWFEGNFAAYETNKVDADRAEAARPHRVTHRRLTRSDPG